MAATTSAAADLEERTMELGWTGLASAWPYLRLRTRQRLLRTGRLRPDGRALPNANPWTPSEDEDKSCLDRDSVVRAWNGLVPALGALRTAIETPLPSGPDSSWAALQTPYFHVQEAADHLIAYFQDEPVFLRMAMRALLRHEMTLDLLAAQAERAAPKGSSPLTRALLAATAPAALAVLMVGAQEGSLWVAVPAAYLFGAAVAVLALTVRRAIADERPTPLRPWLRWNQLVERFDAYAPAGLRVHLQRMLDDGLVVPMVAFDLCEALERARWQEGEPPQGDTSSPRIVAT